MVALGAEELLQVVVGRRQAGNPQILEQAGAVAVGDLEEAVDGVAQGAAGLPAVAPFREQAGVAGLDVIGRPCSSGSAPRPTGSSAGSQRPGPVQTLGEQGPQLLQLRWRTPPFCSIRPRLASIASSRSCRRRPRAADGHRRSGRPGPPRSTLARPAPPHRSGPRPCARSPAHRLFQLFLGVPVGLKDRQGRLAQVVEMAQLMRDIGPDPGDGKPDRMLTVADHAGDRDAEGGQVGRDLAQQAGEVVTGRRQQGASQQDQPGQAIADDPQHFVANIGLKIARMTRP
jgi:hypothetical protein